MALPVLMLACPGAGAQALHPPDGASRGQTAADLTPAQLTRVTDDELEAARQRARAARKAYEDARDHSTPDDWAYVNPDRNPLGMRRFPKPEYEARLRELKRQADLAEQALGKLERERRLYP